MHQRNKKAPTRRAGGQVGDEASDPEDRRDKATSPRLRALPPSGTGRRGTSAQMALPSDDDR